MCLYQPGARRAGAGRECLVGAGFLWRVMNSFWKSIKVVLGTGLPQWLHDKESACKAGDLSSIPGSGRSPRGGHGNPLQYSCLENPMARGAWWAMVHRVTKSRTRLKQLSRKQ